MPSLVAHLTYTVQKRQYLEKIYSKEKKNAILQGQVVQKLDNPIHLINHYPVDSVHGLSCKHLSTGEQFIRWISNRGQYFKRPFKYATIIFLVICALMFVSIRSESKHPSASRKILAQVQEASRRMAAELEAKHPNSKVRYSVEQLTNKIERKHQIYGKNRVQR